MYKYVSLLLATAIYLTMYIVLKRKAHKKQLANIFNIFTLSMMLWSFSLALFYLLESASLSLLAIKFTYIAGSLIPPAFLLYSYIFYSGKFQISFLKRVFLYFPSIILAILYLFTDTMITEVTFGIHKGWEYGEFHYLWELQFISMFVWGFARYISFFKKVCGAKQEQLRYIILGTLTGVAFNTITNVFLPIFRIFDLVWLGPCLAITWVVSIFYTIIKFQFMDIRVAITSAGIFLTVYTIVLGVPFWLGLKYGLWQHSTWLMFLLATAGPVIYSSLRQHAEKRLLVEQKHYQWILIQISKGLSKFKEVSELIKFVTRTVPHVMKLTHGVFYYYDDQFEKYSIKSQFGYEGAVPEIFKESKLINFIAESEKVLLVEEQSQKITLPEWHDFVSKTSAECVVPVSHDKKLLGFLLLGKKKNNQMFTHDDVSMFEIFRDHLAVTMANCQFLERERVKTEEDGARLRRQQIDVMFSTLTHELDNPNASVIGNMEAVLFNLEFYEQTELVRGEALTDIKAAFVHMIRDSRRISAIISAFENYAKGNCVFVKCSMNTIFNDFDVLSVGITKRDKNVKYTIAVEENLPSINVVPVTIEEILMNFLDNAYHSVSLNAPDKSREVSLKIFKKNNLYIRVEMGDNGHGILDNRIKESLFVNPVTTKASSDGTGLGLYRVRTICELHNARYGAESEGHDKGAMFWVEIPILNEESVDGAKKA